MVENLELKDLFTTYWSQVLLLLAGIGYFIKLLFNYKTKKLEINHSLFQQNILNSVNKFSATYSRVELMWNQIPIYSVINRALTPKEIDKIVFPVMNDLDETIQELKVYFKESEYKYFTDIKLNLLLIHGELSQIYASLQDDKNAIEKANNYALIKSQVYAENKKLFSTIGKMIRENFKS